MKKLKLILVSAVLVFSYIGSLAQPWGQGPRGSSGSADNTEAKSGIAGALGGFKFRSIGPAFMSGRIADIAIDPTNENLSLIHI